MPLNYSKWDQLEVSDDSDIEGHPNVDKNSLIRWKQRDIHEKRDMRKQKIAHLRAEIDCNNVLLPRWRDLTARLDPSTNENPQATYNEVVEKLKINPSPDAPPTNKPGQPTYDDMILSLLLQVGKEAKESAGEGSDVGDKLKELMNKHVKELGAQIDKLQKELDAELHEQKKHITSEDLHVGFDNKYVPPTPTPPALPGADLGSKSKKKTTATTYEVLNPKSSSSSASQPEPEEEEETVLPSLTPSLQEFAKIPLWDFQASWDFIKMHRDVVVPGAADALLVAAFRAQSDGRPDEAKKCVHQSKLLNYCDSLGKDGVRVFFQRMTAGKAPATAVFSKDVEDTYAHLVTRVAASLEEESLAGQEQIQLVPENPEQTISFNVPDGPPPANLVLEGPGTEELDVEEVRKTLQLRWDMFNAFPEDLKKALQSGTLEAVNRVLGNMRVEDAEKVVDDLNNAGILNFAEGGIRDETGKSTAEVEGAEQDEGN